LIKKKRQRNFLNPKRWTKIREKNGLIFMIIDIPKHPDQGRGGKAMGCPGTEGYFSNPEGRGVEARRDCRSDSSSLF